MSGSPNWEHENYLSNFMAKQIFEGEFSKSMTKH